MSDFVKKTRNEILFSKVFSARSAIGFILLFGVVNLLADMNY
jgi:hypothetical protein